MLFRKPVGLRSLPVLVADGEGTYGPHSAHVDLTPGGNDKG